MYTCACALCMHHCTYVHVQLYICACTIAHMCIYNCTYVHIQLYICAYTIVHMCMHKCTYVHIQLYTCACTIVYICTYNCTCVHVQLYMCACTSVHVWCMYMCFRGSETLVSKAWAVINMDDAIICVAQFVFANLAYIYKISDRERRYPSGK